MLAECKNEEQVGKLLKTKVLRKLKISTQLSRFLIATRGIVYGVPLDTSEEEIKQGIGEDEGTYFKRLVSRRGGSKPSTVTGHI